MTSVEFGREQHGHILLASIGIGVCKLMFIRQVDFARL